MVALDEANEKAEIELRKIKQKQLRENVKRNIELQ